MDAATGSPTPSSPERGSLGTGDLAAKYTKLASEYSKVRAQLNVLKKAIVEEQSSKNQMAEMLKEQETKARKIEAEMDALNFRNGQLTRRVEILQQESDEKKASTSRRKKRDSSSHNNSGNADDPSVLRASENVNSVMGEELERQIAENVKLHAMLDEIDGKHEFKISNLTSHIAELESKLKRIAQADRAEDTKQKELIQGLKIDNSDLTAKMSSMEKELTDANDRITVLRVQLESAGASAIPPENAVKNSRKLSAKSSGSSNFPLNVTEARVQTVEVLSAIGESIQNFVAAMSDIHTYWEHRLKDLKSGGKLTDQSLRLSNLLLQNVKHLKPIEVSYQSVLSEILSSQNYSGWEVVKQFREFVAHFASYVHYNAEDVQPLVISCLQQESNSPSCPPTQQAKNSQLVTSFR